MKTFAECIAEAKVRLGDPRMSDRRFGEELDKVHPGGFVQSNIARAKAGYATDPLAVAVAKVLDEDPGLLLWIARTEREKDDAIRAHLSRWGDKVGKALARVPHQTLGALAALGLALGLSMQPRPVEASTGGSGRF